MSNEVRTCQNCRTSFTIGPEDFEFYRRIGVPPPTFCYECRLIRRLAFRNELNLYKRKCTAPGHSEEMISIYSPDKNLVVYDQKHWWTDEWDPMAYGREYDFSKPFFQQWLELRNSFPLMSVSNSNAVNSDYCNVADQSKDCYLISGSFECERVLYSNRVNADKDSLDLFVVHRSELCYDDSYCTDCYRTLFSRKCVGCVDSYFLYDCRNCSNCFGCTNLRSRQYYIFNQPYNKEEYLKKFAEFNLGSFKNLTELRKRFLETYPKTIHKYANILKSVNTTGNNIDGAKNCNYCFDFTDGSEDCKFSHWGGMQTKDLYDGGPGVGAGLELAYEVFDTGIQGSRNFFTSVVYGSHNVQYSFNCYNSSDLFGCIGLRSKKYCILNKQYTKDEYEVILPKIIEHMNSIPYIDKKGRTYRYGEFFPIELSPFAYNESIAQDYFPLTKSEAVNQGYVWKDDDERNYVVTKLATDLPDHIKDVRDDILKEVIGCEHEGKCNHRCSKAFKIIPQELQFYQKLNISLPRLCYHCRHYSRLESRDVMKLWHRKCRCAGAKSENQIYTNTSSHFHGENHCPNEFETPYAPEKQEIIYCEQCYNAEVV